MPATLPMPTEEDKRRQPLPEEGQRRWQPLLEEELRQQQKRGSSVWAGGPPAEPLVNGGPAVGQPSELVALAKFHVVRRGAPPRWPSR